MKLLPIEPGCLALVTRGSCTGEIVEVIEFYGEFDGYPMCWVIKETPAIRKKFPNVKNYYCVESALMRIDGNDDLFKREDITRSIFYGPSITEIIKKPAKQGDKAGEYWY